MGIVGNSKIAQGAKVWDKLFTIMNMALTDT